MAVGVIKKLKPEDRSFYTAGDVQAQKFDSLTA